MVQVERIDWEALLEAEGLGADVSERRVIVAGDALDVYDPVEAQERADMIASERTTDTVVGNM